MTLTLRPSSLAAAAAIAFSLTAALPAAAVTLSNLPTGDYVGTFGTPQSETYGQVFTAPVTGTLDSFTMYLENGVGSVVGAVGTWNGTDAYGEGFGSPDTLYTSSAVASASGAMTFLTGGTSVVAGNLYVAFLTVFGLGNGPATTYVPLGTADSGLNYFVWNNGDSPFGDTSWNYFFNAGNILFEAKFTAAAAPIPLPAAGWMLLAGMGGLAALRRRRKAA